MLDPAPAIKIFSDFERFLIICHEDPDGDALGASLALQCGLSELGKRAVIACKDEPALPFRFLPGLERVQRDFLVGDYEVLIVVDCGDLLRTGFAERILQFREIKKPIMNIDHHPKNDLHNIATINIVDPTVAASVQIVHDILWKMDVTITPEIATQLLTGLYTDTGGFKHSNTTPEVLELASKLLLLGGRLKRIVRNISATKSLTALRLWGVALSRVRKHPVLPLVLSIVTQEDLERCHASVDDLGGVVNMINSIPGSQAAVLFTELPGGEIKVSIRTETEGVDVSRIATLFGGGGHKKASGFRFRGRVIQKGGSWRIVPEDGVQRTEGGGVPFSVIRFPSPEPGQVVEW